MEELKKSAGDLADEAVNYVTTLYNHARVSAAVKATNLTSTSLLMILIGSFILFSFLFVGIGGGLWLGHLLNNMEAGFFIIAGLYLLLAIIFIAFRKQITTPLKNLMVKKIYE